MSRAASQHTFARIPSVDIPRSRFVRNMTYKTTFNAGYLIPFYVDEIIPGDTFKFNMQSFARILSPLKYPIMDNLQMDFQFFFVPIRLVYEDYEKFFGSSKGQAGNWEYDDSHLIPGIDFSTGVQVGSIGDYFGLPTSTTSNPIKLRVNALPFRAYNKIINDWYLPSVYEMTGPVINTGASDDSPSDYALVKRIKRCDYFTSALIAPQRGPGASIGLAGIAPVYGDGNNLLLSMGSSFPLASMTNNGGLAIVNAAEDGSWIKKVPVWEPGNDVQASRQDGELGYQSSGQLGVNVGVATKAAIDAARDVEGNGSLDEASSFPLRGAGLLADLEGASAISINSLRQAFQLQRALERDMRGGVQYVSQLMAHFGVRSPDARLQRSEYLGGGSVPIHIHTVANTTGSDTVSTDERLQGSLAGFGVSSARNVGWIKSFTEHGYVIGLVSVRVGEQTYQQGLQKLWDRWSRFDFYYPVFAHIGEQVVLNKELYAQGYNVKDAQGRVIDELPFGYQERYGELRYGVSKITGQLRSTYVNTLDPWHLAQKFNNLPVLNAEFLEENVPMSRVKGDSTAPDFIFDSLISVNCVRPMPLFGVPGLVDHF